MSPMQRFQSKSAQPPPDVPLTTLMIQHLPKSYSRDMVCDLLDQQGLAKRYDFVYLPVKFATGVSFGYAFVNFIDTKAAEDCHIFLNGFNRWIAPSEGEVCGVSSQTTHQGQTACVELYRNSPVMHESVPDAAKPAIYRDGIRIPFPPPTKKIKAPRSRAPPGEVTTC